MLCVPKVDLDWYEGQELLVFDWHERHQRMMVNGCVVRRSREGGSERLREQWNVGHHRMSWIEQDGDWKRRTPSCVDHVQSYDSPQDALLHCQPHHSLCPHFIPQRLCVLPDTVNLIIPCVLISVNLIIPCVLISVNLIIPCVLISLSTLSFLVSSFHSSASVCSTCPPTPERRWPCASRSFLLLSSSCSSSQRFFRRHPSTSRSLPSTCSSRFFPRHFSCRNFRLDLFLFSCHKNFPEDFSPVLVYWQTISFPPRCCWYGVALIPALHVSQVFCSHQSAPRFHVNYTRCVYR